MFQHSTGKTKFEGALHLHDSDFPEVYGEIFCGELCWEEERHCKEPPSPQKTITRSAQKREKLQAWLKKRAEREQVNSPGFERIQEDQPDETSDKDKDTQGNKTCEFKLGKRKSLAETIEIASPGTEALLLGGAFEDPEFETEHGHGGKNLDPEFQVVEITNYEAAVSAAPPHQPKNVTVPFEDIFEPSNPEKSDHTNANTGTLAESDNGAVNQHAMSEAQLQYWQQSLLQEATRLIGWEENLQVWQGKLANDTEQLTEWQSKLQGWESTLSCSEATRAPERQSTDTQTDLHQKIKKNWLEHPPGKVRTLKKVEVDDPEVPGQKRIKYVGKKSNWAPCSNHPNCPITVTGNFYKQSLGDRFCSTCKHCLHWECYIDFHLRSENSGCGEGDVQMSEA